MARVKRGVTTRAKHKRILEQAKGYRGRRKNTIRVARQAVEKAGQYAYRDRKVKKRTLPRAVDPAHQRRGSRRGPDLFAVHPRRQARRDRTRPEGHGRPGDERRRRVHRDHRAGQGGAARLIAIANEQEGADGLAVRALSCRAPTASTRETGPRRTLFVTRRERRREWHLSCRRRHECCTMRLRKAPVAYKVRTGSQLAWTPISRLQCGSIASRRRCSPISPRSTRHRSNARRASWVEDRLHPEWAALRFYSKDRRRSPAIGTGELLPQWPFVANGPTQQGDPVRRDAIAGLGPRPAAGRLVEVRRRAGQRAERRDGRRLRARRPSRCSGRSHDDRSGRRPATATGLLAGSTIS